MVEIGWGLAGAIAYGIALLIPIVMLFVVPRNRKPSSAVAWLLLIAMLPFIGLIIFLLIGSPKLPEKRCKDQRTIDELITGKMDEIHGRPELERLLQASIRPRYQPFVDLSTNLGGLPAFHGNRVELISDYDAAISRLISEIDQAERYVHLEYYILVLDDTTEPFFAALERAVERDVTVRVLFDHIGSWTYPNYREMLQRMTDAGIEWHRMLPFRPFANEWTRPDLRNHRKIVVIDGNVGFTGSLNMVDKTYHKRGKLRRKGAYYEEVLVRLTGPIVGQLQAVFAADWYAETSVLLSVETIYRETPNIDTEADVLCQVLPSGSGHPTENNLKLFNSLIYSAQERVVLVNPYFVPDETLMMAITSVAQRGVDVTLITSTIADKFFTHHAECSFYEELLHAGVRIFRYRSPVILHSKFLTIDDDIAVLGSSNLDIRSFELNLEISLVCYDKGVVERLGEIEQDYLDSSEELLLEDWQSRSLGIQLFDNIARLTSALQ